MTIEHFTGTRIKKIYHFRHALWEISLKQLKSKFVVSGLGVFSAFINPLLIMLAITFVFFVVFKTEIKNFPLFVLSGLFPWMFFSSALSEAAGSILNQQSILRQFNIPREILPLSSILSNFLNFLIGWIVLYPLFVIFNPKIILLFPFFLSILILSLIFISGLGLFLSVLNIFFRDLTQLLGTFLMFWFWITPVFYQVEMIPRAFRWIANLNPIAPFIVYYQGVIYKGQIPDFSLFIIIIFLSFGGLAFGFWVFARLESKFIKWI
jgi:ABC-2 type transport system permease protein